MHVYDDTLIAEARILPIAALRTGRTPHTHLHNLTRAQNHHLVHLHERRPDSRSAEVVDTLLQSDLPVDFTPVTFLPFHLAMAGHENLPRPTGTPSSWYAPQYVPKRRALQAISDHHRFRTHAYADELLDGSG